MNAQRLGGVVSVSIEELIEMASEVQGTFALGDEFSAAGAAR